MPDISIVTPSFNQARFIEECLRSVKEQNYPSIEHIVVDGASTDGTVELLKKYSALPGWEHLRWISEPDRGQSDALNKGFRMAQGDLIGWLNADDRYRPGCFREVQRAFNTHSQADIVYGDYTWIDSDGNITRIRREISFSRFILAYHRVLYIPTTSTFFKRRIFADGNELDIKFCCAMDYDFFLRLARKGYRFQHICRVLADFRWHKSSKSASLTARQIAEHETIALRNSRLLGRLPSFMGTTGLFILRKVAATFRYSQKLVRGYYWDDLVRNLRLGQRDL